MALKSGRDRREIEAVLNFIDWVMEVPAELDSELREDLNLVMKEANMTYFGGVFGPIRKQAHEDGKLEGKLEGKDEGKVEGRAQTILDLLTVKFGEIPESVRNRIFTAPIETLNRWTINILTRDKLEDVLSQACLDLLTVKHGEIPEWVRNRIFTAPIETLNR